MLRAIALMAVVCTLVAACGSSEREEYEEAMRAAVADLSQVHAMAIGFIDVEEDADAATLALRLSAAYRRSARQFRRIEPPRNVSQAHTELIEHLERLAVDLRRFGQSGGRNEAAFSRVPARMERLIASLGAIQNKGYDIGWK